MVSTMLEARSTGDAHRVPSIEAVVIGKAPDMLEGVCQPEQFLVGAMGGHMKPVLRVPPACTEKRSGPSAPRSCSGSIRPNASSLRTARRGCAMRWRAGSAGSMD